MASSTLSLALGIHSVRPSCHMKIKKVGFAGSTLFGRKIMEAAAKSNLKKVTLELGGKSPSIIFDDADLDEAVKWAVYGILYVLSTVWRRVLHVNNEHLLASIMARPVVQVLGSSFKLAYTTNS